MLYQFALGSTYPVSLAVMKPPILFPLEPPNSLSPALSQSILMLLKFGRHRENTPTQLKLVGWFLPFLFEGTDHQFVGGNLKFLVLWARWATNKKWGTFFLWPQFLVGGFSPTHLKNMQPSKWVVQNFPNFRDENKKCLSCHHLGFDFL